MSGRSMRRCSSGQVAQLIAVCSSISIDLLFTEPIPTSSLIVKCGPWPSRAKCIISLTATPYRHSALNQRPPSR